MPAMWKTEVANRRLERDWMADFTDESASRPTMFRIVPADTEITGRRPAVRPLKDSNRPYFIERLPTDSTLVSLAVAGGVIAYSLVFWITVIK